MITCACQNDNDLYLVLTEAGLAGIRYNDASAAVKAAAPQTGVMILADRYPTVPTEVEPAIFAEAVRKRLRLYIEFPVQLPNMPIPGTSRQNTLERVIVQTDVLLTENRRTSGFSKLCPQSVHA